MSAAIVAAAGISALAVFFLLVESESLSDGHARVRTQVLNSARWAFVIALAWVLIPVASSESGPQRGTTILGMVALVGALLLVPVRWFVRIGGREPRWDRDAALWGADLDDADGRAIEADVARRTQRAPAQRAPAQRAPAQPEGEVR